MLLKIFERRVKGLDGPMFFEKRRSTAFERSVRESKAFLGAELHRKAFPSAAGVHLIRCLRREVVIQNNPTMHGCSIICQAT